MRLHKPPAMTLANKHRHPLTRLNTPKAVPRRCAGAVSATSVDSRPCVKPMCRPQNATPIITTATMPANASTRSATISSAKPAISSDAADVSDRAPAGQADSRCRRRSSPPSPRAPAPSGRPTDCARSSRKASLKRASVKTAATPPPANRPARRLAVRRATAARAPRLAAGRCGSRTKTRDARRRYGGNHGDPEHVRNCRRKGHEHDRRQRPEQGADGVERLAQAKGRAAQSAGVRSATSASRGAPRMPLPTRSTKRAPATQPMSVRAERSVSRARPARSRPRSAACVRRAIAEHAGKHLGDRRGHCQRLGETFTYAGAELGQVDWDEDGVPTRPAMVSY